ncbi:MAG: four helix bundle protein [Gemmatimonas sp.]|jgi:four helix bundle protein|uniref:four helix bundle protein n=1 Tax=Gemmatimonas sp. TaxID=1962908 RepID=UPI0025C6B3F0|nr:four helix bundle protein [Gemmatimonas sp.]MCA2982967.1 four helix bundle protein [Gemmatimonas sp.]MCA2995580.1 four helix bundle protein [Gemmatimonas sp.]MCE2953657.1 four helix bundle protein [Gemmatimonas sp.]
MSDPRNLRVLEAALYFADAVHQRIDRHDFTRAPRLRAQLLRAVDSVPANIAEGARGTRAQFANHLRIARGSADEVGVHLRVARHAGAIAESEYWRCENKRVLVCKMLTRFLRTLDEEEAHAHHREHMRRSPP